MFFYADAIIDLPRCYATLAGCFAAPFFFFAYFAFTPAAIRYATRYFRCATPMPPSAITLIIYAIPAAIA